jgi:hypothetical protein
LDVKRSEKQRLKSGAKATWAVKKGVLVRPKKCPKCGNREHIEGHHWDYDKPLMVEWMCRKCHRGMHKILRKFGIALVWEGM